MTSTIGPYEIRGRLGVGAMAVVWRGWDPKLEREVAIKEPQASPGLSADMAAELADRLVTEGKTAARLSHPGIVTIYAADVFDGRSAIVMELLRGHTLSSLIDSRALPLDAALSILDQLLAALDYAHTMGVVHRDVKPDNVLVTDDGRVKLTDFGVAHVSQLESGGERLVAGTPGYMAPEQIRAEIVDGRADVFGMGALAYELLTHRNPFGATEGLDGFSIKNRTLAGPEPVFDRSDGVPPAVQSVILRALARDPVDRFATAGQMRLALEQAASGSYASSPGLLAELVDELPPSTGSGVSFTAQTLGSAGDHLPKKGSYGWTTGVALGVVLLVLVLVALMSGAGTIGFGVLGVAAAAIGGAYWVQSKRSGEGHSELPPEAIAMSKGLRASGPGLTLELRGPHESRTAHIILPCLVGRSADAGLDVADDLVSREHALIERRDGEIWVTDLSSRNGTFVDGFQLTGSSVWRPGAIVIVGSTELIMTSQE